MCGIRQRPTNQQAARSKLHRQQALNCLPATLHCPPVASSRSSSRASASGLRPAARALAPSCATRFSLASNSFCGRERRGSKHEWR